MKSTGTNNKRKQVISIVLPDLSIGGAERQSVELANDFVKKGFSVELVLMRRAGELLELVDPSVSFYILNTDKIRNSIIPLAVYLRKKHPSIILAGLWPLTSAAVFSWIISGKVGNLYLVEVNPLSVSTKKESGIPFYYLSTLLSITHRFASGIIAISKGVKKDLCRAALLSDKKVKVIYDPAAKGIQNEIFSNNLNQLWGDSFKIRILAVGLLTKQKDFETLIAAFSIIHATLHAKLVIIGDGPLRNKLLNLIDQLDLHHCVDLPGYDIDLNPWYHSADLFVLSSRWEGFGNVIVEALEHGLPVVSTDCPSGPAEILENGRYGNLVAVGDKDALAASIIDAVNNPIDSDTLKQRASDFSVDKISNEYIEYITS